MTPYNCGHCLFLEECGSSDVGLCWKKEEYRKITEYPCGMWKPGRPELPEESVTQFELTLLANENRFF